jgi:hypothetical protein
MNNPKNHDTNSSTTKLNDLVSQDILNDIYEAALTSICIEIASDMHRCAKTGLLPYSHCVIPKRRKVPVAPSTSSSSSNTEGTNLGLSSNNNNNNNNAAVSLHVENETQRDARDRSPVRGGDWFDAVPSKSPLVEPKANNNNSFNYTSGQVFGIATETRKRETTEGESSTSTTVVKHATTSDTTEEERTVLQSADGGASSTSQRRRRSGTTIIGDDSAAIVVQPTSSNPEKHEASISSTTTPSVRSSSYDIYGRIPPKEPKITSTMCLLCGRSVSAIRFAPHLEKCMGLTAGASRTIRDI